MRGHAGRALDLGTGCGVQSYHLSRHADQVVATDLNPRALRLARLGAALSGMDVDFREGSLYEPVVGERFDLIVSKPISTVQVIKRGCKLRSKLTYRKESWR